MPGGAVGMDWPVVLHWTQDFALPDKMLAGQSRFLKPSKLENLISARFRNGSIIEKLQYIAESHLIFSNNVWPETNNK